MLPDSAEGIESVGAEMGRNVEVGASVYKRDTLHEVEAIRKTFAEIIEKNGMVFPKYLRQHIGVWSRFEVECQHAGTGVSRHSEESAVAHTGPEESKALLRVEDPGAVRDYVRHVTFHLSDNVTFNPEIVVVAGKNSQCHSFFPQSYRIEGVSAPYR